MQLKDFIIRSLDQHYMSLVRSVDGLTQAELQWSPNPQAMSIGFLAWHYARTLDRWIHSRVLETTQIWEQRWAESFGRLPPDPNDTGYGYSPERLQQFNSPEASVLLGYAADAKDSTISYLNGVDDDSLDRVTITNPRGGRISIATMFQQLIWECNQHGGQIAYIRGLQRGIEDAAYSGGMLESEAEHA